MLDGISWASILTQALQTGGALVMVLLAWSLPRVMWRGALWWFNSGSDRGEAERAALARLLDEAEQRGYRRGWCAAEEALNDKVARVPTTTIPTCISVEPRSPITSTAQTDTRCDSRSS